jgi:RNA polymerase sigma factor (sigma-70 family)
MPTYSYAFKDHRILSVEEEQQLFKLYTSSTTSPGIKQRVRDRLITYNMKFAARCANLYVKKCPHVHPDDLKGYAMEGLIASVDRFDYTRGVKFTSFAVWWIKNYINRNVECNESLVRYPANIHQKLQRAVNNKTFSDEINVMFETIKGGISLNQPIFDGDSSVTVGDLIEDETVEDSLDILDSKRVSNTITSALASLDETERYVIEEAFGFTTGEKKCVREIADEIGIPHENVRYIRGRGIEKLKRKLKHLNVPQ